MLSQTQIDAYHRDGFLIIRGLFAGDELAALRAAADRVQEEALARKGQGHLYRDIPGRGNVYFRSETMWDRDPVFRAATVKPALLAAIGQCVGHPFLPINDSFVIKLPRGNVPIEWHQDPPYGCMKPEDCHVETLDVPNFDVDIYLDHSTVENGCVWGIPGHHLVGHCDIQKYTQDELIGRPDAVPMIMAPGDVLFHSLSAPHGSIGNTTDQLRRIFYIHYMAKEVVEGSYPWWGDGLAERGVGFNPKGLAKVRGMIDDRRALGYDAALGAADVAFDDTGLRFTGSPSTPAHHWRALIDAIPEAEKARRRALIQVAQKQGSR